MMLKITKVYHVIFYSKNEVQVYFDLMIYVIQCFYCIGQTDMIIQKKLVGDIKWHSLIDGHLKYDKYFKNYTIVH